MNMYLQSIIAMVSIVIIVFAVQIILSSDITYTPYNSADSLGKTIEYNSGYIGLSEGDKCITPDSCPGVFNGGECVRDLKNSPRQICGCQDGKYLEYLHCSDMTIHCGYCP